MKRALTAPGYIYSAVKDDGKSQAFFENQYLRVVDCYDDVLADDPAGRGLGAELSVCAARHAGCRMKLTVTQPTAHISIPRQTTQPRWSAGPSSQNRTTL